MVFYHFFSFSPSNLLGELGPKLHGRLLQLLVQLGTHHRKLLEVWRGPT